MQENTRVLHIAERNVFLVPLIFNQNMIFNILGKGLKHSLSLLNSSIEFIHLCVEVKKKEHSLAEIATFGKTQNRLEGVNC